MDASTPQPENTSTQGGLTADWPLADFPDPNPYFPPPARPLNGLRWSSRLPWKLSGALLLCGMAGMKASITYWEGLGQGPGLSVLLISFFLSLVGIGTFFESLPYTHWKFGRIIPVRVDKAAAGPPPDLGPKMVLNQLFPFAGYLLINLFQHKSARDPARNELQVRWLENGSLSFASPRAEEYWHHFKPDDVIWLCVLPWSKPVLLAAVAPPQQREVPVPDELAAALRTQLTRYAAMTHAEKQSYRKAIRAAREAAAETERELHEAAKNTTRVHRRAAGNKRKTNSSV